MGDPFFSPLDANDILQAPSSARDKSSIRYVRSIHVSSPRDEFPQLGVTLFTASI